MNARPASEDWRRAIVQLKQGFAAPNRVEVARGTIATREEPASTPPALSFVMVVGGAAPLLAQALSSLQQQDVQDWECIVVDDCSPDYSLDVARLFAAADARFRVVWHGAPRGLAAAGNSGFALVRGQRVGFLDPTTMQLPGAVAAHLAAQGADGTYCDWRRISPSGVPQVPRSRPRRPENVPTVADALDQGCPSAAVTVRREVLDAQPFDESAAEPTTQLWRRLLEAGARFAYVEHIGVGQRTAESHGPAIAAGSTRDAAPGDSDDLAPRVLPRHVAVAGRPGEASTPEGAVLLVPQVRYHVDELGPLADELRARGVPVAFMPTAVQGRLGEALRDQVLTELSKYTDSVLPWDPALPRRHRLAGVVVLNDWGTTRELVITAQAAGVPTFAKVEGVQDFSDRDTGRDRRPYRTSDVVLAQGPNDVRALPGTDVHVVGSTRLEKVLQGPASTRQRFVAINVNFTYDVLVDQANDWLSGAVEACRSAGLGYVICPHPAQYRDRIDPALVRGHIATEPLRAVLLRAGMLVTRFSSVLFESIARGVPVVYHNPHDELAWHGQLSAEDALPITTSAADLASRLPVLLDDSIDIRTSLHTTFVEQIDVCREVSSAVRAADVVTARLA